LQMQEKHLADSLDAVRMKILEQDSLQRIQDSLALLTNELAMEGSEKDSLHQMLDDMLLGNAMADSTAADSTQLAEEEQDAPQKEVLPVAPSDPVSLNDIGRFIKMLEAQRAGKPTGKTNQASSLSTPSVPVSSTRSSILDNLNAGTPKKPEPPAPRESTPAPTTPPTTAPAPDESAAQPDESEEAPKESSRRRRSRKSKEAEEAQNTDVSSEESPKVDEPKPSDESDSVSEEEDSSSKKKKSRRKRRSSEPEEEESSENEGE
ncbi:MAG: hypothetical protein IKZ67_07500, partial [Paludibacteraceae bacterium]|nr:hypothetical protein [Paludibacteraceae bacterium]